MKTAIVYYSKHHTNTYRDRSCCSCKGSRHFGHNSIKMEIRLSDYDRIGLASGIYYSNYAKQIITYAEQNLPEEKLVFYIYTHGAEKGEFLKGIRAVVRKKNCKEIGEYHCRGYDTFGPFKFVGGIAKGHPTEEEICAAVSFYKDLSEK